MARRLEAAEMATCCCKTDPLQPSMSDGHAGGRSRGRQKAS